MNCIVKRRILFKVVYPEFLKQYSFQNLAKRYTLRFISKEVTFSKDLVPSYLSQVAQKGHFLKFSFLDKVFEFKGSIFKESITTEDFQGQKTNED